MYGREFNRKSSIQYDRSYILLTYGAETKRDRETEKKKEK